MTTYLSFLAWTVAPPLVLLVALRIGRGGRPRHKRTGLAILLLLALLYTTPWDNLLIRWGVWTYGEGTVTARVWRAPVAEYLFIAGQTLLVGVWVQQLDLDTDGGFRPTRADSTLGLLAGAGVALGGLLALSWDATVYLGAILAWAGPVLAVQWAVGWRYLVDRGRTVAIGVAVPALYLACVDRYAIANGLWLLSDRQTTEITVLGLPIEEGCFFLVTSTFVVQGLVLYDWVVARWG